MMPKQKIKYFKNVAIAGMLFAIALFVSMHLNANPLSIRIPGNDSSMFQYFGYAMRRGDTLYTEIFDHKGPIIFIINWLATYLNVGSLSGIWLIELVSIYVFMIYTYKTARIWLDEILSFIPVIISSLPLAIWLTGGNLTEEYSLPFIAYSLYVFIKYLLKRADFHKYEIVLTGLDFAIVFLLRPNNAMLWVVFAGFIFFQLLFQKKFTYLLSFTGLFLLGVGILVVPLVVYLGANQALQAAFFQTWTFNISYLGDTSYSAGDVAKQFQELNTFYLTQIMLAYLAVLVFRWKKMVEDLRTIHLLNSVLTVLTGYLTIGSGRAYSHYLIILIPCFTLAIVFILKTIFAKRTNVLFSLLLIGFILLGYHDPISVSSFNRAVLNSDGNHAQVDDENKAKYMKRYVNEKAHLTELATFIKENTEPEERIYSHRLAGNVYLMSGRLASIKYFNLPSIDLDNSERIATEFLEEFFASETRLVVVKRSFVENSKSQVEQIFYDYLLSDYILSYDKNEHLVFVKE